MMKVNYTHRCRNSSIKHLRKHEHWAILLTSIDIDKTDRFAFGGIHLGVNAVNEVKIGSLVVEACGNDITLFRVTENGKVELAKARENRRKEMDKFIELTYEELLKF